MTEARGLRLDSNSNAELRNSICYEGMCGSK